MQAKTACIFIFEILKIMLDKVYNVHYNTIIKSKGDRKNEKIQS